MRENHLSSTYPYIPRHKTGITQSTERNFLYQPFLSLTSNILTASYICMSETWNFDGNDGANTTLIEVSMMLHVFCDC